MLLLLRKQPQIGSGRVEVGVVRRGSTVATSAAVTRVAREVSALRMNSRWRTAASESEELQQYVDD